MEAALLHDVIDIALLCHRCSADSEYGTDNSFLSFPSFKLSSGWFSMRRELASMSLDVLGVISRSSFEHKDQIMAKASVVLMDSVLAAALRLAVAPVRAVESSGMWVP